MEDLSACRSDGQPGSKTIAGKTLASALDRVSCRNSYLAVARHQSNRTFDAGLHLSLLCHAFHKRPSLQLRRSIWSSSEPAEAFRICCGIRLSSNCCSRLLWQRQQGSSRTGWTALCGNHSSIPKCLRFLGNLCVLFHCRIQLGLSADFSDSHFAVCIYSDWSARIKYWSMAYIILLIFSENSMDVRMRGGAINRTSRLLLDVSF
jgi:hypothetical protein